MASEVLNGMSKVDSEISESSHFVELPAGKLAHCVTLNRLLLSAVNLERRHSWEKLIGLSIMFAHLLFQKRLTEHRSWEIFVSNYLGTVESFRGPWHAMQWTILLMMAFVEMPRVLIENL